MVKQRVKDQLKAHFSKSMSVIDVTECRHREQLHLIHSSGSLFGSVKILLGRSEPKRLPYCKFFIRRVVYRASIDKIY